MEVYIMSKNEIGECPFCNGGNLRYCEPIIEEELIYPWKCEDCGSYGQEAYKTEFIGHRNTKKGKKYSEENRECQWCKKLKPHTEGKFKVDLGFICDTCIRAIESRGEKLSFLDEEIW